jgi:hypothetical protein
MHLKHTIAAFTGSLAFATSVHAADPQTGAFLSIFGMTCISHIADFSELEGKLASAPLLPKEKAAAFLNGREGSAWSIPNKNGIFVISLTKDKKICAVYARRIPASETEERFQKLVESAPQPLTARLIEDERGQSDRNGATRRIAYEWSRGEAAPKIFFVLTTANSEDADVQGLLTASVVR